MRVRTARTGKRPSGSHFNAQQEHQPCIQIRELREIGELLCLEADMVIAQTERLTLRHWQESDRQPFARLNADPRVMEFMASLLTEAESGALADRIEEHFEEHGFGLCAAEVTGEQSFIGFIGLAIPAFQAEFTPCVEIGWRLAAEYWGRGFATEGAREMVRYAFEVIGLESLVSLTVPANIRSRRVMEKLGMTHNPRDDFEHPKLPEGHALRHHVLYRLNR
jgi:ribosomal-protein-alanine N-acetyltransferase